MTIIIDENKKKNISLFANFIIKEKNITNNIFKIINELGEEYNFFDRIGNTSISFKQIFANYKTEINRYRIKMEQLYDQSIKFNNIKNKLNTSNPNDNKYIDLLKKISLDNDICMLYNGDIYNNNSLDYDFFNNEKYFKNKTEHFYNRLNVLKKNYIDLIYIYNFNYTLNNKLDEYVKTIKSVINYVDVTYINNELNDEKPDDELNDKSNNILDDDKSNNILDDNKLNNILDDNKSNNILDNGGSNNYWDVLKNKLDKITNKINNNKNIIIYVISLLIIFVIIYFIFFRG
jgi:hypothetical protein